MLLITTTMEKYTFSVDFVRMNVCTYITKLTIQLHTYLLVYVTHIQHYAQINIYIFYNIETDKKTTCYEKTCFKTFFIRC